MLDPDIDRKDYKKGADFIFTASAGYVSFPRGASPPPFPFSLKKTEEKGQMPTTLKKI